MSSSFKEIKAINTVNNPYHPMYLCTTVICRQYFQRHSMKFSNISDTGIPIKKFVLCNHCGNSWFVCTVCKKAFVIKNKTVNRHFRVFHNLGLSPHLPTPNINKNNKYNFDDVSSISALSDDDNNQNIFSTSNNDDTNKQNIYSQRIVDADMSISHKQFFIANMKKQGKGLQQLVAKAVLKLSHIDTSPSKTKYHLNIATFCQSLDYGQREHF